MKHTALHVIKELKRFATQKKARVSERFFKTGPGEYGEGDVFWGITMPEQRSVVKKFVGISLGEIRQLIRSRVHEQRMVGFLLLIQRYKDEPDQTYVEYLKNIRYVNNWDLVDATCEHVIGAWLRDKNDVRPLLRLARSRDLWERRIAIISTFAFLKKGDDAPTYLIADVLLHDEHDLIRKAVGWMLREAGKRVDEKRLRKYLDKHAKTMPRTALRYAIERLPKTVQKTYLRGDIHATIKS
jgi:3-methyladenine DNA glycosylase AlkD